MAMDGKVLGDAIATAINGLPNSDKTNPTKIWETIGGAIVAHIKTNAVVSGPVTVTSVSAVTTGTGVSGPGSGSLSGGSLV